MKKEILITLCTLLVAASMMAFAQSTNGSLTTRSRLANGRSSSRLRLAITKTCRSSGRKNPGRL